MEAKKKEREERWESDESFENAVQEMKKWAQMETVYDIFEIPITHNSACPLTNSKKTLMLITTLTLFLLAVTSVAFSTELKVAR